MTFDCYVSVSRTCRFVYYFNCLLVLGFWHCYSTFFGTCASTQVIGKSSRSPRLPLQIPWFVEVTFCLLAHNGKLVFLLIEQQAAVDTCTSTDKFLSKRAKRVKLELRSYLVGISLLNWFTLKRLKYLISAPEQPFAAETRQLKKIKIIRKPNLASLPVVFFFLLWVISCLLRNFSCSD